MVDDECVTHPPSLVNIVRERAIVVDVEDVKPKQVERKRGHISRAAEADAEGCYVRES
jgi:hypothetical protein